MYKRQTRHAAVLFAPEMARGLFAHFLGAIRGSSQYRKSSFLLGAAGEAIFPSFLQMQERPHIRKGLASSPFDDEGVATRDRDLVRAGVLQGYVLGSYSARKLGLKTTGNAGGVHNLRVSSSHAPPFNELLARMRTGLLLSLIHISPIGRVGLAVCYDVRFPELFRDLGAQGAQVFVLPSAFTAPTGRAHWETLLRARAIENLCYMIAPAQSGFHPNGRETFGDSMIVDHWGRILARLPRGRGCVSAEIDLGRQAEVRKSFPALLHRVL